MNELATTAAQPLEQFSTLGMLSDPTRMNALIVFADLMASAAVTVPQHLRGKKADCLAITMQAARWNMDPFAVAQKTHLVNGALGYEAQLILAVLQSTGAIEGAPFYEYQGKAADLECRVGMILAGETEPRWTQWVRNGDIKTRNSPLWQTNPAQQLGYLQVKYWARQYAPGAILGIRTKDELEDIEAMPERFMGDAEVVKPAGPRRRSEIPSIQTEVTIATAPETVIDGDTGEIVSPEAVVAEPVRSAAPPASTPGAISGGQVAYLRNKLRAAGIAEPTICNRFEVDALDLISLEQFSTLKAELLAVG
jgi:hypothetical protein